MTFPQLLLIINIFATFYLTGLIWLVQVVNYPLFAQVLSGFESYHQHHVKKISLVVALPMLAEAFSGVLLLWFPYPGISQNILWAGVVLIFVVWIVTAVYSVPCHNTISGGFEELTHKRLVATNWIRVLAWSLRSVLLISVLMMVL